MTVSPPLVSPPRAPTPLITRHAAPSDISSPHIASRVAQANGLFTSSPMLPMSHSTSHISSTPLVMHPHDPSPLSHTHSTSRPEQASGSSHPSSIPLPSRSSAHPSSSPPSPPRKKRSRRCFVCGGTGKHRLNPRYCPRTFELLSRHLATFDANFRLISFDGSPLPMTRHPGGVAAHLLSRRHHPPHTPRVSPRSVSESPLGSHLNPPHVPRVPHAMPAPTPASVPFRVPNTVPASDLYTPHTPPAVVELPRCLSTPDHSFEANPPHFPHVERPSSPPFRILIPFRESLPHPETPPKSNPPLDNAFILLLFDCIILSPSWRRALAALIDGINRLNLDDDIPALQKLVEPLRERFNTFISVV